MFFFFAVKSAGKDCQFTAINIHCLLRINEPSLDLHHILLSHQQRKETKSTCEGLIDKEVLKRPHFKIKFWKTVRASVTRDAQRLKLLFPARVIPTIKIVCSAWLKKYLRCCPRLQHALLHIHIKQVILITYMTHWLRCDFISILLESRTEFIRFI